MVVAVAGIIMQIATTLHLHTEYESVLKYHRASVCTQSRHLGYDLLQTSREEDNEVISLLHLPNALSNMFSSLG